MEANTPVQGIMKLPTELFDDILEYLLDFSPEALSIGHELVYIKPHRNMTTYCLVNRQFYKSAMRLLYQRLELNIKNLKESKLSQSLRENPSLFNLCTTSNLNIDGLSRRCIARNQLCSFANVRVLHLQLPSEDNGIVRSALWRHVLPSMQNIQTLSVLYARTAEVPEMVRQMHLLRRLETLCLHFKGNGDQVRKSKEFIIPRELRGTGTITSLTLRWIHTNLTTFDSLLTWPRALRYLDVHFLSDYPCFFLGSDSIYNAIQHQKTSLRAFDVPTDSLLYEYDLRTYPKLETIYLNGRYGQRVGARPHRICDTLFGAPQLTKIVWMIELAEMMGRELRWMLAVVKEMKRRDRQLQEIQINLLRGASLKISDWWAGALRRFARIALRSGVIIRYNVPPGFANISDTELGRIWADWETWKIYSPPEQDIAEFYAKL